MSHRTKDLPAKHGIAAVIRELRYHEASRQILAVVLIALYAAVAAPQRVSAFAGLVVAVVGEAIRLYASGFVMKNVELATNGPYAFVRHPLYTGNILLVTGFALASSRWWALPLALLFFWFYYPPAIEYEDRKLRRIFGAQWEEWAARTPALVPALRGARSARGGSWSLAKSQRQNGELVIAAFVAICVGVVIARL
ncbi:MAG TPA: isoprenylcysteine carboxylmethyltransferase family protein [Gammaproteobacteria bacterium]